MDGEHTVLTGFQTDTQAPEELIALLCSAISQTVMTTKPGSLSWAHWLHFTTGFISSSLSQSTSCILIDMGMDVVAITEYTKKHAKTMTATTQEAMTKYYRERDEERRKQGPTAVPPTNEGGGGDSDGGN